MGAQNHWPDFFRLQLGRGSGVARNFKGGGHNHHIFLKRIFFGRTNLKLIEKQEKPQGMLPWKIFENLHAVMAILVPFEYFSDKLCLSFLILILSASLNMMHFVRTFLITRA